MTKISYEKPVLFRLYDTANGQIPTPIMPPTLPPASPTPQPSSCIGGSSPGIGMVQMACQKGYNASNT